MRSRYSAFSLKKFDYLKNTFTTGLFSKKQIQANEEWAQSVQFTKLEILFHEENQKTGKVEFKAYFYELGIPESTIENASEKTEQCHHEKSKFRKQNEKWLYDGVYLS